MRRIRITLLLSLMVGLPAANAMAADCTNPNPRNSAIWQAFDDYVKSEYGKKRYPSGPMRAYAYGHALGRLATAVDGHPAKEQGFECAKLAAEQTFGVDQFFGGNSGPGRIMTETLWGYHDDIVAREFGVTDHAPLHEVFARALQLMGRTSYGPKIPKTRTGGTGNPAGGTTTPPNPVSQSSTAPSKDGINEPCMTGDRGTGLEPWALMTALSIITDVREMGEGLGGSTCEGANFSTCQEMNKQLHVARDHVFQVFDQNHDGIAHCRLCNYDRARDVANLLVWWQNWLGQRYYNASGLGNIFHTIGDNMNDPICKVPRPPVPVTPSFPPPPVYDDPPTVPDPTTIGPVNVQNHVCADTDVPSQASWKFYRYTYGGGAQSYKEKNGLICMGRTSYRKITSSSWEEFKCDYQWENCQPVPSSSKAITEVKPQYAGPGTTKYGHQTGYGVRTSN